MADEPEMVGEMRLRGRLSGDSIEGGGTFLLQTGGGRYELVVPAGIAIPDAPADATFVVFGRLAPEVASFRQQGTLFMVTGIELDRSRPTP